MKFCCEKAILQHAVAAVSRAASVKAGLPVLEGILFECEGDTVTLTAYDLKMAIYTTLPAEVSRGGSCVLSARLFGDIVRKLPDEIVTVEEDGNLHVTITCGLAEFEIMALSAKEFPDMPSVSEARDVVLPQRVLKECISQTVFAVSDVETRATQTGSLFTIEGDKLTVASCDGYRVAVRRETVERTGTEKFSFIVPGVALREVEKILSDSEEQTVSLQVGRQYILFVMGDTALLSRLLEGNFLQYEKSIPAVSNVTIEVSPSALLTSVERVSLMVSEKLKSPVRILYDDGQIRLRCVTTIGQGQDSCLCVGDGTGIEAGFNNRYLIDALRAAPDDTVSMSFNSAVSPLVIRPLKGDSFLHMVLPVRLSDE